VSGKVLYVAGYGRSGSTLMCAVLGGNHQTFAIGEFKGIFAQYVTERPCSCGKLLSDCLFWREVVEDFKTAHPGLTLEDAALITTRMESCSNWLSLRHRGSALEQGYQAIWKTMIDSVCRRSGCTVIVDASKSSSIACNRVAVLSRIADVRHIHLVRDPRAVMSSTLVSQQRRLDRHGIKPTPLRGLRTLFSWMATNSYIHLMHAVGLQKVQTRVSYEMFTDTPQECMNHLANTLDMDVSRLQEKIDKDTPFEAGHIFSGDLQRMKGDYQIRSQVPKWPQQLTSTQKIMSTVTFPLARYYGFFKGKSHGRD
jgi:hypothetical protein